MNQPINIICLRTVFLVFLYISWPSLQSADLFGEVELEEGEIPITEQIELYQHFFGKVDKAASNASKQLKLALQLQTDYHNEKFSALRRYILIRIAELCGNSKKKEAIDLQVFVFVERYKKKESNYQDNSTLIKLLEKQIKKAAKDHRESIASEIVALLNENALMSLKAKDYERAAEDLKNVSAKQSKLGDKDGAKLSKNLSAYIEDYLDEKADVEALKEKLKTDPTHVKHNSIVGRFHLKESNWVDAAPFLQAAQEVTLAHIAEIAQQKDPTDENKIACIVAIAKAIEEKSNKKDIAIKRALLQIGVTYRSELNAQKTALNNSQQVKFSMISDPFEHELAKLGPDPLNDFSFAAGGGTVNEARLLRNGWELIFDHKQANLTSTSFKNSDASSCEVKNGILIVKAKSGNKVDLGNIPDRNKYKGIHIRFKYITQAQGKFTLKVPGMNGQIMWVYFYQNRDKTSRAGFTTGYAHIWSPAYGSLPLKDNEWNDLRMIWDGKTAVASLNGVEFEKSPARPSPDADIINFSVGGKEDCEVHIQSYLGLKR